MIAALALAGRATGSALCISAALDSLVWLGRVGGLNRLARPSPAARLRHAAARLAARYDGTASARALAVRLDAASVLLTPARWRAHQLAAVLVGALLAAAAGVPLTWALALASIAARVGGALYLRSRRDRRDDELLDASARLARHLVTELTSGSTAAEAMTALTRPPDGRHGRRLEAIVAAAASRSAVGDPSAQALHAAVAELPFGRGRDALAVLATELELVVDRGCGTAVLTRLASGIEERRQTVAEVRAATAEIRMATLAIPGMAIAVASLLVLADHAVAGAALSPVGATVGATLGSLAASAVGVARHTSPWEPA